MMCGGKGQLGDCWDMLVRIIAFWNLVLTKKAGMCPDLKSEITGGVQL